MIYLTGVIIAIIFGWLSIMFTEDRECNILVPRCALVAVPLLAIFSWLTVVLIILVELRQRISK